MNLVMLSCLAALFVNTSAQDKVNLCGTELARARVLLCFGKEYILKRSQVQSLEPMDYEDHRLGDPRWLWRGREVAHAARWARNKRGLVDECCLKPCTQETITSYC